MFKLHQEVVTKKTGFPTTGKIVGIYETEFVQETMKIGGVLWDELYPGWEEKPVYAVRFRIPQRPMTFDEYLEGYKRAKEDEPEKIKDMTTDELRECYMVKINFARFALYPEDDLEAFDQ